MFKVNNFLSNDDIRVKEEKGAFKVIEFKRDLSVMPGEAERAFYCEQMNVLKRQIVCDLKKASITTQAGAMQWTVGNVEANSGIKGAGDLLGKAFRGKATGESAVKPEYKGSGILVLEPTYRHLFLIDVAEWGGGLVLSDGMFLACESQLEQKMVARQNLSSTVAGGEGLFNLCLNGSGIVALESAVPFEELIEVQLDNDVLKLDGNFAVAWSSSLNFSVERSGKSLLGSAASGEGLVNVYRGTGKVLMAPVL